MAFKPELKEPNNAFQFPEIRHTMATVVCYLHFHSKNKLRPLNFKPRRHNHIGRVLFYGSVILIPHAV